MHTRDISVGGRTISIETGRIAKQADGAVIVRSGDTMVLVTACADANPREGVDFLPLTCDYKENAYASGRIPGGFFKREGKPPEKEVLTSRLIDRPIRPLFPDGWRNETQIIALVISADTDNDSDVLAITGASAALALSSIPQSRTLAGVRVGFADGDFIINPTFEQRKRSTLDLVIAGTKDGIVMVEAGAKEVPEDQMVQALERAPRGDQGDRAPASTPSRRRPARPSAPPRRRRNTRRTSSPRSRARCSARSPTRCGSRTSSRTTRPSTRSIKDFVTAYPGRRRRAEGRREDDRQEPEGKDPARRDPRARHAARRPQVRRDPQHHDRSRRPAAHARLLPLHARRDPGARGRDARHRRRPAEGRDGRRRDLEALHAPLQLPAVLGRRSEVPARPRPPRDRPRRARRALARCR